MALRRPRRTAQAPVEDVDIVQLIGIRHLRDEPPAERREERRLGGDFDEAAASGHRCRGVVRTFARPDRQQAAVVV